MHLPSATARRYGYKSRRHREAADKVWKCNKCCAGHCLEKLRQTSASADDFYTGFVYRGFTKAAEKGVLALDAPVSGGDLGAKAGTLSIMCGGSAEAMEAARPLLEHMGNSEVILHFGEAGARGRMGEEREGMHTQQIAARG